MKQTNFDVKFCFLKSLLSDKKDNKPGSFDQSINFSELSDEIKHDISGRYPETLS